MNLDYQYFIKNSIDIYKELGINRDASNIDIRKAYINKVKETHPDQYMTTDQKKFDELSEKLKLYNKIMNVFSDEAQRKKYDNWYDKNIKTNYNNGDNKQQDNDDTLFKFRENAKIILYRIGLSNYISEIEKANTKEDINSIIYKAQKEFSIYKNMLKERLKMINMSEDKKAKYEQKIDSCNSKVLFDIIKEEINNEQRMSNEQNKGKFNNNTGFKSKQQTVENKNANKLFVLDQPNKDITASKPQPIKVVNEKPSWWSRNWKKVLIAAGIATVAVLAAPYIVQPLMMLNSIAWHHVPAAIQTVLHGINVGLGTVGSVSPFASFSYAAGEWAINGAVFNAAAASGSTFAAIAGIAADLGMAAGLGVVMKKGYKSVKQGIKAIKAKKNKTRSKNNKKDEVKQNIDEKINQAKETYNNTREKVKKEKKEKDNNRKIGFINKWKEKYNNYKTKTEIPIPDNDPTINPISQKQELNNNLSAQREWINSLPYSSGVKNSILSKISNVKTVSELDNILDNNIYVKAYERKEKDYGELENYKLNVINTLAQLNIDYKVVDSLVNNIQKSSSNREVNNIMNNKQVVDSLKRKYCNDIINEDIDIKTLSDIIQTINSCSTVGELINCVKKSEEIINNAKMANNEERKKGKVA